MLDFTPEQMAHKRLTDSLIDTALAIHKQNKQKACRYLRDQRRFYAHKSDRYRGTPYHEAWHKVYKAYSSAAFHLEYILDLEDEAARDMDRSLFDECEELYYGEMQADS